MNNCLDLFLPMYKNVQRYLFLSFYQQYIFFFYNDPLIITQLCGMVLGLSVYPS